MAMSADTLASELEALDPVADEAPVIENLRNAWDLYFAESTVKGISPIVTPYDPGPPEVPRSTPYDVALDAFAGALTGISTGTTAVQGATYLVNAMVAFWGALAPLVPTVWVTVPPLATLTTIPTGLLAPPTVIAALAPVFTANTVAALSKPDCMSAIAAILHANNTGATVTDTTVPTPLILPVL